jgi:hypothetical protein
LVRDREERAEQAAGESGDDCDEDRGPRRHQAIGVLLRIGAEA